MFVWSTELDVHSVHWTKQILLLYVFKVNSIVNKIVL